MKVLFVTASHRDHLALTLFHGLCEVLGPENVVDACVVPSLHRHALEDASEYAESSRHFNTAFVCREWAVEGAPVLKEGDRNFDLLVVNSCFITEGGRDRDAAWRQARWYAELLKPDGKVAFVEGNDSAHFVVKPPWEVDAVFRKEIDPSFAYPYDPVPLTFAAPDQWFVDTDHVESMAEESTRDIDVFYTGNPDTNGADKWAMCRKVFETKKKHNCILGTCGLGWENYLALLRRSRLALCPSTAAGADSMRTYEAVACGAIPVFVEYPNFKRDPWFDASTVFYADRVGELPRVLDNVLSWDLADMRRSLLNQARQNHTTRARARRLLEVLGYETGGRVAGV